MRFKHTKLLLISLVLMLASGCAMFKPNTPFIFMTGIKIPKGTPMFQKGFADGCSSGMYSRGNHFYKAKYGFKYDPKLMDNKEYWFANKRGYSYCFTMMANDRAGAGQSWDAYLSPNGNTDTMIAKDIGSAWGGFFGGTDKIGASEGVGGFLGVLHGGSSGNAFGNPLWAGGSKGQFFGQ